MLFLSQMAKMVKVVTWNVLADCYARRQPNCLADPTPLLTSNRWEARSALIAEAIREVNADIYCLQEVDHYNDFYYQLFDEQGFESVYKQRPGKKDGCLVAFRKEAFRLEEHIEIDLNDLTYLDHEDVATGRNKFAKSNVAQIAVLRSNGEGDSDDDDLFFVVNCHIHWNPSLLNVKFAQVQYIWEMLNRRLHATRRQTADTRPHLLWGGDFNSLPDSEIYHSWHTYRPSYPSSLARVLREQRQRGPYFGDKVNFLCDANLSRLARWLRLLGRSVVQQEVDTRRPDAFFDRARAETRVILTASRSLLDRASCPLHALYVASDSAAQQRALFSLYRSYGLCLDSRSLLSICGKCGGDIQTVSAKVIALYHRRYQGVDQGVAVEVVEEEEEEEVQYRLEAERIYLAASSSSSSASNSSSSSVPLYLPQDGREVYSCKQCAQPYWWNEAEDSSAAKALKKAKEVYDLLAEELRREPGLAVVMKEGEKVEGDEVTRRRPDLPPPMTRAALADDETAAPIEADGEGKEEEKKEEEARDKEEEEEVMVPWIGLRSVFFGSEPAITNWNGGFRACLDYLLIEDDNGEGEEEEKEGRRWEVVERAVLPRVHYTEGGEGEEEGGITGQPQVDDRDTTLQPPSPPPAPVSSAPPSSILSQTICSPQPSHSWPSDHFMVTATLRIVPKRINRRRLMKG